MFFNTVYDVFEYKACGNVPQRYMPIFNKKCKTNFIFVQVTALSKATFGFWEGGF